MPTPYYYEVEYDTLTNGVQTATETVRIAYEDLTCSQQEALFSGLNEAQIVAKRATMSTAVPTPPSGWTAPAVSRNCNPSPSAQIVVQGDNAGFTPDAVVVVPGNSQITGGTVNDDPAATVDFTGEDPNSIQYLDA